MVRKSENSGGEAVRLREMVLCGLFIALVAVGALIRIPVGSDVYTLQFMFTLLAGLLLGGWLGALAVGTYVLMGLVGIPVFASGGGPSYVLQPTFGYLVGFTVQAWVCGKMARQSKGEVTLSRLLGINLVGMAIVYVLGISYFWLSSNYLIQAPIGFWAVLWYCGVLQVVPDFLLCLGAAAIGIRCRKAGIWV
jgi:biotin transport system substrate-specific component